MDIPNGMEDSPLPSLPFSLQQVRRTRRARNRSAKRFQPGLMRGRQLAEFRKVSNLDLIWLSQALPSITISSRPVLLSMTDIL